VYASLPIALLLLKSTKIVQYPEGLTGQPHRAGQVIIEKDENSESRGASKTKTRPSKSRLVLATTFRSLRNPDYRIYATSQLISNCGSWIQMTAISWLVFELSDSAFMLGLVNFLRQSPVLFLGLAAGWLADNFQRKIILWWTKVAMTIQALALGILTVTGVVELWHVCVLATLLGIVNAFDMPAKQAFTFNLVKRRDLVNAVSLNTSSFHASRSLGPVIAIFVVHFLGSRVGEGTCFLLNALSYLFVMWALLRIKAGAEPPPKSGASRKKPLHSIPAAMKFIFASKNVLRIFALGTVSSLLCMQYLVLMPVFAKTVLSRQIDGFGMLMSGAALGSFVAALLLANRGKGQDRLGRGIVYASIGFALALIAFSLSRNFLLSCLLTTVIGFCSTMQLSASNAVIQLSVEDQYRGQVLSVWMIVISGLGPVGGLVVGYLASLIGAPMTMAACGGLALVLALSFLVFPFSAKR